MNQITTVLLTTLLTLFSFSVHAQIFESSHEKATLIELYTSEGCSSCPPADKWLSKLKSHPDLWTKVVPVAFHVDYWDWIGWKDDFAKPEFGKRQKRYRTLRNTRSVYTPGFFSNGNEWRDFFSSRKATPPIYSTNGGKLKVSLKQQTISATFTPPRNPPNNLELNVAELSFNQSNFIKFGENIGKTLNHDFIVGELHSFNLINQDNQFFINKTFPKLGKQTTALAIWVSDPSTGEVLQAVGGNLKSN